ncbi:MAG: 2,4-dienoyl-CoA reductase-like NADH-dependent reductase (Old Yellow Enzyme family) [Polyangiales bacterium]|jgi:2,4-dienoyl-CoA reductase-like NADH-dependent reductase (Old Yellow Enzyme family)
MPDSQPADVLGQSFTLPCGVRVNNRILKSAMSEILGTDYHAPTARLAQLYKTWAEGGAGLLITGNVMVDRSALGEPGNVALEDERDMALFRAWAEAGRASGAHLWMQINHPGKQSPRFLSATPVAPSAISLGAGLEHAFNEPRALTEPEILDIIERFATTARLAKEAGFTGVQIHGAHGYLVSQFLSPHHNQRDDGWGGTAEKRMRFVLEVYRGIRAAVGADFPVAIKLNSADFHKGGFTQEESAGVVAALASEGIDLVEISGGTYETSTMVDGRGARAKGDAREGFFMAYAELVRESVDVPLALTGGFRSDTGMAEAITSGAVDFVGLARAFALEPGFPAQILAGRPFKSIAARPTTGFKSVDRFSMLDVTWYENQLARIADGKEPLPTLSPWRSIGSTVYKMGFGAFRQRRVSSRGRKKSANA